MTTYTVLRHGHTLDDLDRYARTAVRLAHLPGDPVEHYETAHTAAVTALYEAEHPPDAWQLVDAARDALWAEQRAVRRHHGYANRDYTSGAGTGVNFCKYWAREPSPDPSERIVDGLAAWQILPLLTPGQRAALAAFGDYVAAANSLGVTEKGFGSLVAKARRVYHRWWFEHETPPRGTGRDRRVWRRNKVTEIETGKEAA
jgi:hypothetical protein